MGYIRYTRIVYAEFLYIKDFERNHLQQIFETRGLSTDIDAIRIKIVKNQNGFDYIRAFIKFDTYEQASKAVTELNLTMIKNRKIHLYLWDAFDQEDFSSKIYAINLSFDVDEGFLRKMFKGFPIIDINILNGKDFVGNKYKYAIITFSDHLFALKAIKDKLQRA